LSRRPQPVHSIGCGTKPDAVGLLDVLDVLDGREAVVVVGAGSERAALPVHALISAAPARAAMR
jgi:hypothetical protein